MASTNPEFMKLKQFYFAVTACLVGAASAHSGEVVRTVEATVLRNGTHTIGPVVASVGGVLGPSAMREQYENLDQVEVTCAAGNLLSMKAVSRKVALKLELTETQEGVEATTDVFFAVPQEPVASMPICQPRTPSAQFQRRLKVTLKSTASPTQRITEELGEGLTLVLMTSWRAAD
ncbi:hypothetical protein [Variovorax sp. RCC_210]|uniref:hypothetical protein n=1 Tax=Variovorax sp. RCC_210 TaxID=3239217 RepID=UPI00352330A2